MVDGVISILQHVAKLAYLDADHRSEGRPHSGFIFNDKIEYHRIDTLHPLNSYDLKILSNQVDIGLVNGNHFRGNRQIVVINQKKKDSLYRKLDRLDDVRMIVLDEGEKDVHHFLNPLVAGKEIPVFYSYELDRIAAVLLRDWKLSLPPVHGLVLAGGKSSRMGTDKAFLKYHDREQARHMAEVLKEHCKSVAYSLARGQTKSFQPDQETIYDLFDALGPFGGILSAFRTRPDVAWLVVACDQPLLSENHIEYLLAQRNPSKIASCFHNPETGFPEPLITLWEPRAYPRLLEFLAMGYACPRKVLINSDVELLHIEDHEFMKNANTKDEMLELKNRISGSN